MGEGLSKIGEAPGKFASKIGGMAESFGDSVLGMFKPPQMETPSILGQATPEGDTAAMQRAEEEATRRSRAAAAGAVGRRATLLTGSSGVSSGGRKTVLGA